MESPRPRAATFAALAIGGETVEHGREHVFGNAASVVSDIEAEVAAFSPTLHVDGRAFRCEIDGVGQDLDEDLFQSLLVGNDMAEMGRGSDFERDIALLKPVCHLHGNIIEQIVQVDVGVFEPHDAGIDGREVEDIVDNSEQHRGRGRDVVNDTPSVAR